MHELDLQLWVENVIFSPKVDNMGMQRFQNLQFGMPTRPIRSIDDPQVTLEVHGATFAVLFESAKHYAAEFFGVDPDTTEFKLRSLAAKAEIYDSSGRPISFWARIVVELVPESPEPAEDAPDGRSGPRSAPPRTGSRPLAPASTPSGQPFDWDDDDDSDEDATGLSEPTVS